MLIGDPQPFSAALEKGIKGLFDSTFFKTFTLVTHPREILEGGFSKVELEALKIACYRVSTVRALYIWSKEELSDTVVKDILLNPGKYREQFKD